MNHYKYGAGLKVNGARSIKRTVSVAAGQRADKRRAKGEKSPPPPPKSTRKTGVNAQRVSAAAALENTGKSAIGDDVDEKAAAAVDDGGRREPTMTGDNYVRLLQDSLTRECQSYFNGCSGNGAQLQAALCEDAVAVLVKRALDAVQVGHSLFSNVFELVIRRR